MEERLTELETKISFQEQTIEELTDLLTEQQRQIDHLTLLYTKLEATSQTEEYNIVDQSLEVPPPHY